jgi:hypothetical protein
MAGSCERRRIERDRERDPVFPRKARESFGKDLAS